MRSTRIAMLIAVAALALAACSSSSTAAPPAASAAPPAASSGGGGGSAVTIKDFAFAPATLEVAAGTTVTWTNQDSTSHTVVADDGSFKSDPLGTGATFTQTFATAGTFTYHCSIHPSMKATITVK
jgi:plastocyanin